jgi:hypothetical protein
MDSCRAHGGKECGEQRGEKTSQSPNRTEAEHDAENYAATPAEALLCRGCPAIVVGGGNSAGQAAVFLSTHASRVLLLIRGNDLNKNMSSYLVHRIEQTRNAVFSFIGATPRTDWLPPEVERDAKGFPCVPGPQTRCIRGRRRRNVGAVRPRVSQGNVRRPPAACFRSLRPMSGAISATVGRCFRSQAVAGDDSFLEPDLETIKWSRIAGDRPAQASSMWRADWCRIRGIGILWRAEFSICVYSE